MKTPLTELTIGDTATIVELDGGEEFQRKLRSIGIREGKVITLRATHPFGGPVVLEIDHRQSTVGRTMAEHILLKRSEGPRGPK